MKSTFPAACALLLCAMLSACASKQERGYGIGPQAEREAAMERTSRESALPDSPGMYLALIDKMQSEGMYYASLAHIDAYEKRYGRSPDSTLRRADALRQTEQMDASRVAYEALLKTKLAARGYRGLGLLAGQANKFDDAAKYFRQASELEPTDASILSDLGYALLREGAIDQARVPLMKAAELARDNTRVQRNLVLYLLANGQNDAAQSIMTREKFTPEAQRAMDASVKQVLEAARTMPVASTPKAVDEERSTWSRMLDAAKSITASNKSETVATTTP
jgi:Flp pilus assembly protein TadD